MPEPLPQLFQEYDEKYNEEIKRGKIICGRPSYGDEPEPVAAPVEPYAGARGEYD